MRKLIGVTLLPISILAGCASTPEENSQINSLEQEIQTISSMDEGQKYAPIAVQKAKESLEELRALAKDDDSKAYEQQLYITQKKVEIAEQMIAMNKAEEVIGNSELRRKDILLDSERQNVQQARAEAAQMSARAQSLESKIQDLKTKETERGLVLTLGNVLFESGEATLRSGSKRTIENLAQFLNEYPEREILIEGFTDSTGAESFNQSLSEDRAEAVKALLVRSGVASSRVQTTGYGEEFPVASNDNQSGRLQNRRVEIIVSKDDGEAVSKRL